VLPLTGSGFRTQDLMRLVKEPAHCVACGDLNRIESRSLKGVKSAVRPNGTEDWNTCREPASASLVLGWGEAEDDGVATR
jgi:hypothetical protein